MDFIVPFITGLTTGGLSCLAVQGGLLAGSIAHEVEQSVKDMPVQPTGQKAASGTAVEQAAQRSQQGARPAARGGSGKAGPKAGGVGHKRSGQGAARASGT